MYDFKGKVAFVTGGASGIGLAIIKEFLKNEIKAVFLVDFNPEGENVAKQLGPNVYFHQTDVTKEEDFEAAFKTCISKLGGLDIVMNNAGNAIESNWRLMHSLNTTAVVQGTLLGLKYMGKDKGGKGGVIINTSSIFGVRYFTGMPLYTATKHFVVGLGRSIGSPFYFDLTGVRVLTLCPGITETNITKTSSYLTGFPGLKEERIRQLLDLPLQSVENVGKGVITMFHEGKNGSTWVVENDQPAFEDKPTGTIYA